MTHERGTLFAGTALARRIERAEVSLSTDIAEAVIARGSVAGSFSTTIAGGVAVFTGPESPVTKVIGLGFDGAADPGELTRIEQDYFARGGTVRAEVATLADPAIFEQLTTRGYVLGRIENVLGLVLDGRAAPARGPDGLTIGRPASMEEWRTIVLDGFEVPDTGVPSAPGESFPRGALEAIFQDVARARGFRHYLARLGDEPAGGGSLRIFDGIAQLAGASTLPRFRRRGIQSAMLEARLADAAEAGCDLAVVTTEPGSKSQQNAQRAGFSLLYARAILTKRPPGRASAAGADG